VKAIVFDRYGPPEEVLSVRDVPQPVPRRGEVLVRMLASPINPSDVMYVQGRYGLKPTFPATPGFEGVGVVEANGGGILGMWRKGKRVAVINDRIGNWGEYTVTKARQCVPVPDDLTDEQAATFFVNPATAVAMTRKVLAVPPGEWLLQNAAGSALGKMVIRLGKKYGFWTMNVVRRREQVEELKARGADEVLVESDGPIHEQVDKRLGGRPIHYAIDPVGGKSGSEVIASLGTGGRCLVFGSLADEPVSVSPRNLIGLGITVEGFWLGTWAKKQSIPTMLRLFRSVRRLMCEGTLTSDIAATYSMEQIADAARHATAPGKGGKVLLRIGTGVIPARRG
jgi:NADPH:quinone reductase-like Zn-dependent oxidoreductase